MYYHFILNFIFKFHLVFINLFRWQWFKCVCPFIIIKRIPIFKSIMLDLSIKLSRYPQQDVTCMHWKHITQNLINILINWKRNQDLFNHFHLTTIIQQLQPIKSIMLNHIQVQFTNKDNTSYISPTSIIYNQITLFILYMATCMKYVLFLAKSTTLVKSNILLALIIPKSIYIHHHLHLCFHSWNQ